MHMQLHFCDLFLAFGSNIISLLLTKFQSLETLVHFFLIELQIVFKALSRLFGLLLLAQNVNQQGLDLGIDIFDQHVQRVNLLS